MIDLKVVYSLTDNLRDAILRTGLKRVVIGLSGGVDSALTAALAVRALGADNVKLYFMPAGATSPASEVDAHLIADTLGVALEEIDITAVTDIFIDTLGDMPQLRFGNILSRVRMTILFDKSAEHSALVLGTANKSELLLGYTTLYGDSACAINPIGDLYKTQVLEVSRLVGLPDNIIKKVPSADHFEGQTDEGDLGFSYADIDPVLYDLFENGLSAEQLIKNGYGESLVANIVGRVARNGYKRTMPEVISIGQRDIFSTL